MTWYNTVLAAENDIILKRGDKTTVTFSFTDPNNNDDPFDLSQFTTLVMQVKWRRESSSNFLELSLANGGITVSGASNNIISYVFTETQTDLKPGYYWFDVEGDGHTTVQEGQILIDQDATRVS